MFLPAIGSRNFLELGSTDDVLKSAYSYAGGGMAFGRVINVNSRVTLMMGDGRQIVTKPDGLTTNVWLQGNPFNTMLSTSNFVGSYPGRDAQAIAYNYSGTYRVNHNMNASVNERAGIINGIRNHIWTILYLLDPKVYNPNATQPNHAIVTTTVFFGGLTRIDQNAILQLGDGTVGNMDPAKTLTFSDGTTYTSPYSSSSGNGMLMTKGNDGLLPRPTNRANTSVGVLFEILNNGKLIVSNTPGALDATTTGASAGVAGWVSANLLDGITGKGSVEQIGTLPLTLGSPQGNPNTYTGGTTIRAGAVLIAGSPTALGRRDSAATVSSTSGRVFNRGTLQAAENQRPINVPGDYNQSELTTGPLPVELSAFAAAPEEPATVHLTWTTSSEKNSAHFEVERSTNGEAGFTAIGQLPAAGTSTTARAYRLTDARLPDAPQLYYRLRQVDTDGTVSYSPIRVVARPSAEPAQLQAYPNPAAQSVHVRLLGPAQPAPLELLDATGRLVRTLPAPAAGTEAVLPLTGLPAGLYVLRCGKLRQSLTLQ